MTYRRGRRSDWSSVRYASRRGAGPHESGWKVSVQVMRSAESRQVTVPIYRLAAEEKRGYKHVFDGFYKISKHEGVSTLMTVRT